MQSSLQALKRNHFELFGLANRFAIDKTELSTAFERLRTNMHPDRFVRATPAEKRFAMQVATQANEAFQTLSNPMLRARYLCELNGQALGEHDNTAMTPAFLMQQMDWREQLDDTREQSDGRALAELTQQVSDSRDQLLEQVKERIDGAADFGGAADVVRRLMFIDKFIAELRLAAQRH